MGPRRFSGRRSFTVLVSVGLALSLAASDLRAAEPTKDDAPKKIEPEKLPPLPSEEAEYQKTSTPKGDFSVEPPRGKQDQKAPEFDPKRSELVSRSEKRDVWENPDGTFTARVYTEDKNFQDDSGDWREIDADLKRDEKGDYENTAGPTKVRFKDQTDSGSLVTISEEGWSVGFDMEDAEEGRPAEVSESKARYADVQEDVDLEYELSPTKLKENIVLNRRPEAGQKVSFDFPLITKGLSASQQEGGPILFSDEQGEVVLTVPQGEVVDFFGAADEASLQLTADDSHEQLIRVDVDEEWLADPARDYPVFIDPTFSMGTGGNDTTVSSAFPNTNYSTLNIGRIGQSATYGATRTYMKFDTSFLDDKNVLHASFNGYYPFSALGPQPTWFRIQEVAASWTASTLTWNNKPSSHSDPHYNTSSGEGEFRSVGITDIVKDWQPGGANRPNHGLLFYGTTSDTDYYKHVSTSEQTDPAKRPYIEASYGSPPNVPAAVSPADEATVFTTTPRLDVQNATDPDGDPLSYEFRVSDSPDLIGGQLVHSGLQSQSQWDVPVSTLRDGITYYWTVYVFDGGAWVPAFGPSWIRSFTVEVVGASDAMDSLGPAAVDLMTGNLSLGTSSPSFPSVGGDVGLSYNYNSLEPRRRGLNAIYFNDVDSDKVADSGEEVFRRVDSQIDFDWWQESPHSAVSQDHFIGYWTGFVTVPTTGTYTFGATSDDGVTIGVNSATVLSRWFNQYWDNTVHLGNPVNLTAGQAVPFAVAYYEWSDYAGIKISVKNPAGQVFTVPADWFAPGDVGALPQGWLPSAGLAAGWSYEKALVTSDAVVLISPDGAASEYKRNGVTFIPPEGATGTLTMDSTGRIVLDESEMTYVFGPSGELESARSVLDDANPIGPQYTYAPLPNGGPIRLDKITEPASGRIIDLSYGSQTCPTPPGGFSPVSTGMLCRVSYWDGSETKLFYVGTGLSARLARIDDPGGELTDFAYDSLGRINQIRNAIAADAIAGGQRSDNSSTRTLVSYDSSGRVASVESPESTVGAARPKHSYVYGSGYTEVDVAGVNGAAGYDRRVDIDAEGYTTSERGPDGLATTYVWDDKGRLLSTTDAAGRKSTTIYDSEEVPTDTYGPAPSSWFGSDDKPLPAYVSQMPHTKTTYDEGVAFNSLGAGFWKNSNLSGQPTCHDTGIGGAGGSIHKDWVGGAPACLGSWTNNWSARLTGEILMDVIGTYRFAVYADEGVRLWLDEELVVDKWSATGGGMSEPITTTSANERKRVRIESFDGSGNAELIFTWIKPGQVELIVPGSSLSAAYKLATSETTFDAQAGDQRTTTTYAVPHLGLATASTRDPNGAALTTQESYEASGYHRRVARTLPANNSWSYEYYGPSGTIGTGAPCGLPTNTIQGGALKKRTGPDPSGPQGSRVEEYAYDSAGRTVATRVGGEPWSCTGFDTRGRVTSQTYPSFGNQPARTVSTNYAVGGNPLVRSVTDSVGTITKVIDLLGRTISITDVWGQTTTTDYDQLGRPIGKNGPAGAEEWQYSPATNRLSSAKLDGQLLATPTFDAMGELSSVNYPTGSGNGGNGTQLSERVLDEIGRDKRVTWQQAGGGLLTSHEVTRSQSGRVIDEKIDGTDPYVAGTNFLYDPAGRLTTARVPGRTTTYDFAGSGGCGSLSTAGKNTNRTSTTINGGSAINYCYDEADRLTSTTDTRYPSISYDARGNTSTLGGSEGIVYDGANRHVGTTKDGTSITYLRDALDRIVSRTATTEVRYRSSTTASTGSNQLFGSTSLTINKPAGVLEGDLLLMHVAARGGFGVGLTPPSGWTLVRDHAVGSSIKGVVYQRFVGASEPTSYTVGLSPASAAAGGIAAFSGVDPTSPIEGWSEATASSSTSVQVPSLNASAKGRLVGLFAMEGTNVAPPAGMTERWEVNANVVLQPLSTSDVADELLTSTGGTGSRTATSSAPGTWLGHLIALRPRSEHYARYGYSDSGDSADFLLNDQNQVIERLITLPGSVVLTKRSSGDVWSYSDLFGSIVANASGSGVKQGATRNYDPYGEALGGLPDNAAGSFDLGWLGENQVLSEHEAGIAATELGARVYVPGLGRFVSVDPIEGGCATDYTYVHGDPVNSQDVTGEADMGRCRRRSWKTQTAEFVIDWKTASDSRGRHGVRIWADLHVKQRQWEDRVVRGELRAKGYTAGSNKYETVGYGQVKWSPRKPWIHFWTKVLKFGSKVSVTGYLDYYPAIPIGGGAVSWGVDVNVQCTTFRP